MRVVLFVLYFALSLFAEDASKEAYELTQDEIEYIKTHKTITFTGDPNWLPYEAFDEDGNYIGIVADHLRLIEEKLNIRFDKQISKTWTDALDIAMSGRADVISGDASDAKLNQSFKPIDTYLKNPIVIVMKHPHTYVDTINDIADKRIAIIKNYGYTADIFTLYPQIDFIEVENIQEGLLGVETGEYDAMLASLALASYTIVQMALDDLDVVGKTDIMMNVTLFVNKEKELLFSILNKAMSSISRSEQQDILSRWRHHEDIQQHDYSLLFKLLATGILIFSFLLYRQFSLKKHADELRSQKELFDLVFDKSLSSVLIIDIERNKFIDCNEPAIKMLQCESKSEVLELRPADLSPEFQPDGRRSDEKSDEMNALAVEKGSHTFEWQHLKTTGEAFWVEVILTPIILKGKKVLHVVWKDIQERKDNEAALAQLNERLDYAVSGTNDGLWDWNMATEDTIYFSPRFKEMIGFKDDEFTNSYSAWEARIHPDDLQETLNSIDIAIENPDIPYRNIHRVKHKDGHWVWVLDRARVIVDNTGTPIRMVGFYTDISQIKALESQLLENERIYSDFFENTKSANIIYATNDDGKTFTIKELNSQVEKLEGIKKEEVVGKRIDEIFEGVAEFGLLKILKQVYDTGEPYKMPLSLYQDKNLMGWRENYIFKLSNGDIVASYEDKTQEKRLDLLLSNTINSVENLIFVKDMNSKFIECNTAFERFMDRSRDELIGKSDDDFFDKELAEYFRSKDKEMLASGKPQTNYEWVTFPDGSEVYLLTVKSPLRDSEGNILGLVGNAVDVTSQHNAQREIAKLKSALDRSPISIMMTDIHGNIEYVNPNYTKISGYSLKELLGKNPRIVKSGSTSNEQYKKMWKEISSGHIWSSDIRNIAKNGSSFWENSTILPTFNDDNEVDGYIAFKLDITDKVNMQRELQDKEELMVAQSRHAAMGEMISMIAHQWRQPITVIAMGANNMIADIELQDMNEENFRLEARSILEQTQYLSKTIDDFRDFFRPNKEKEDVYIKDILSEAIGIIGKSLEHSNITLSIENDSTTSIHIYSRELLQVFMNLLKNAKEALVEHTPQERQINITIKDTPESVITTICDNGGGINDTIIDQIFNPYFSTKTEQTGTGLGLYMSKTIIDKHLHGSITPTSEDGTTCFEISIPILSPKQAYHDNQKTSEDKSQLGKVN